MILRSVFILMLVSSCAFAAPDFFGLGHTLYKSGKFSQAAENYEKACALNDARGCSALAEMYDKGDGIDTDMRHATEYYKKACDVSDGRDRKACIVAGLKLTVLGLAYETGSGLDKNTDKAFLSYETACGYECAQGCTNLGRTHENGIGTQKSYMQAAQSYQKACSLGDGNGCYALGRLFELGLGVKPDMGYTKKYYAKACILKIKDACDAIKRIKSGQ